MDTSRRAQTGAVRPTLAEVAARAGCSPSAVSLVVSGKSAGRISAVVAERVGRAVAELGYRPHHAARSLATGDSRTTAVVVPDAANPYYAALVSGLAEDLPGDQVVTLVVAGSEEPLAATLMRALAVDPAALVVASPAGGEALRRSILAEHTIVLDAPGVRSAAAHIDIDVAAAGRLCVEHLLALGHTAIAWLGPHRDAATFRRRRRAVEQAAAVGGATVQVAEVSTIDPDAAAEVFEREWDGWLAHGVTAVVCADDLLAFGVLFAAQEAGIRIPDDVAVVGMGNLWDSRITAPSLTTVDLHARELGLACAAAITSWAQTGIRPARRTLTVNLVVRASTG